MSGSRQVAGLSGGTVLAAAVLHLYWLTGGRAAATYVIPTTDWQADL